MGEIILLRHGETEWSAAGRHTSTTELPLTPNGERQAAGLAAKLAGRRFAVVLVSPRQRARRTAELAGLPDPVVEPDLVEWEYGEWEGRTKDEIWREHPDWDMWRDGFPGGETPDQVAARVDRVLARVAPLLADGDAALVGHGHCLRVAGARWIGLPPGAGGLLRLDTGTVSALGHEHDRPVIRRWNA